MLAVDAFFAQAVHEARQVVASVVVTFTTTAVELRGTQHAAVTLRMAVVTVFTNVFVALDVVSCRTILSVLPVKALVRLTHGVDERVADSGWQAVLNEVEHFASRSYLHALFAGFVGHAGRQKAFAPVQKRPLHDDVGQVMLRADVTRFHADDRRPAFFVVDVEAEHDAFLGILAEADLDHVVHGELLEDLDAACGAFPEFHHGADETVIEGVPFLRNGLDDRLYRLLLERRAASFTHLLQTFQAFFAENFADVRVHRFLLGAAAVCERAAEFTEDLADGHEDVLMDADVVEQRNFLAREEDEHVALFHLVHGLAELEQVAGTDVAFEEVALAERYRLGDFRLLGLAFTGMFAASCTAATSFRDFGHTRCSLLVFTLLLLSHDQSPC